ncbi:MAG: CehA/McbA family metallohydrolase [Prolixibacteraceae bacterium]|jgi:hypothetical protein|nr:CehA/McbA family metallohydrolase [Prolixibacteraceae bacterium]
MKTNQLTKIHFALLLASLFFSGMLTGQNNPLFPEYHIYSGNTHSHTIFTYSHGAQWDHVPGATKFMMVDSLGVSRVLNSTLKENWQEHQGPPSAHYELAKASGYDFYAVTDHSQEADFHPTSPNSVAWVEIKRAAEAATDHQFVALRGFEYSENNGPGGNGHINVYNTSVYLNALEKGNDLPSFYQWLATVPADGNGPVVACFNHPGAEQYNNWDYRTPEATEIITLLEMINSNNRVHYPAFIRALEKGWKVAPVCGNDNHWIGAIAKHTSRTFVLATEKTKAAILDAMKNRRTYASLDNNIQCRYTVNGKMMGATLNGEKTFQFNISVSDPDTGRPENKITKIEIVKDNGETALTYEVPDPAHNVRWEPTIADAANKYFFVRIWNAGGGDAPRADPNRPVAWLAPVWTGR